MFNRADIARRFAPKKFDTGATRVQGACCPPRLSSVAHIRPPPLHVLVARWCVAMRVRVCACVLLSTSVSVSVSVPFVCIGVHVPVCVGLFLACGRVGATWRFEKAVVGHALPTSRLGLSFMRLVRVRVCLCAAPCAVAMLSDRITWLQLHIRKNNHDKHSLRTLSIVVSRRRKLLRYMMKNDYSGYRCAARSRARAGRVCVGTRGSRAARGRTPRGCAAVVLVVCVPQRPHPRPFPLSPLPPPPGCACRSWASVRCPCSCPSTRCGSCGRRTRRSTCATPVWSTASRAGTRATELCWGPRGVHPHPPLRHRTPASEGGGVWRSTTPPRARCVCTPCSFLPPCVSNAVEPLYCIIGAAVPFVQPACPPRLSAH
jgi:ribosomal protein S15